MLQRGIETAETLALTAIGVVHQVAPGERLHIGVGDGGAGALVLADLGQHLVADRHRQLGRQLGDELHSLDDRTLALADPKSSLQEAAQARGIKLPEYRRDGVTGRMATLIWLE